MIPPTSIDGTDITGATIDGTDVSEITVDGQTVFTASLPIPDEQDLFARYSAKNLSQSNNSQVTLLQDLSGNGRDLTASSSHAADFVTNGINGLPSIDFDAGPYLEGSIGTMSQPYHVFMVYKHNSLGSGDNWVWTDGGGNIAYGYNPSSSEGRIMYAGSDMYGSQEDTNPHISSQFWDGSNTTLRIDGTQDATGNPGSNSFTGISLGTFAQSSSSDAADYLFGEMLLYNQDKTSIQSDVENYLSFEWSISV